MSGPKRPSSSSKRERPIDPPCMQALGCACMQSAVQEAGLDGCMPASCSPSKPVIYPLLGAGPLWGIWEASSDKNDWPHITGQAGSTGHAAHQIWLWVCLSLPRFPES